MATKETEKTNVTGLDTLPEGVSRKDAEYDLVSALLEAADFQTSENNITTIEIKRNGKFMFAFNVHPISEPDTRTARKNATTYMPNPNNKKLPPIEKEFNNTKYGSWLIYLATTEEDKVKIWGNPQLMAKKGLMQPWESVDALLNLGEKRKVIDTISKISGLDDDDDSDVLDDEEFQ